MNYFSSNVIIKNGTYQWNPLGISIRDVPEVPIFAEDRQDAFIFYIPMAGHKPSDVTVHTELGFLVITSHLTAEQRRFSGVGERIVIPLPASFRHDCRIHTSLANGLLSVFLTKPAIVPITS